MKRCTAILFLVCGVALGLHAQDYRFAIGAGAGISGYLGDVNTSNIFRKIGFSAGAIFRYNINNRFAVKAMSNVVSLSGDSKYEKHVFPGGEHYAFKSTVIDAAAQFEFNFLNYGIGSKYLKLKRISPYLALGLGANCALCNGSSAFSFQIPMGFGVKFKLKERLNLGAEWSFSKVFGDHIEGLSDLNGITSGFVMNLNTNNSFFNIFNFH